MIELRAWGWDDALEAELAAASPGLVPGRVVAEHRDLYRVRAALGELAARVSGRLRHQAHSRSELPVVGDWVLIECSDPDAAAVVRAVLPRRTRLSRKVAGERIEEQVLAANVDTVWIANGLDLPLSLRRIERYLALAWESGALPAVLLTKSDLATNAEAIRSAVRDTAIGAPVHVLSSITGEGLNALDQYLGPGSTIAVLGPSGVGKSTLINRLAGEELLRVAAVRPQDHRGRHTTTHRQLIRLPGGGLIVDTPGMRELQLWDSEEGIADTFGDIEELAGSCRFRDCQHDTEPGCAVLLAVLEGRLAPDRLENWRKLQREKAWLDRRTDPRGDEAATRHMKTAMKTLRFHPKYGGQE